MTIRKIISLELNVQNITKYYVLHVLSCIVLKSLILSWFFVGFYSSDVVSPKPKSQYRDKRPETDSVKWKKRGTLVTHTNVYIGLGNHAF